MKFFPILILSMGLLITQNTCPKPRFIEPVPAAAAVITWVAVAPALSYFINTVPNPLWAVGDLLVGPRDLASRCAMGGIVAGTVATCAAYAVYQVLKSPTNIGSAINIFNMRAHHKAAIGINKLRGGN